MKKILLTILMLFSLISLFACAKITNENIFKSGIYESRTNGELTHYYTFYKNENSGTVDVKDGMTGVPFRFDILEVKGNKAELMFHMADEGDNTEATVIMKNDNEYTVKYKDGKTDELKFVDEDLNLLESYFNLHNEQQQ
ncbi:MAG: hypothetical protein IJP71_06975 [Lachnospiraceae bacterium]|nr:hypothetical protein [Lachnospiraceae bacterium]